MEKLLIIDSNSIINRAFYGIPFLSSRNETPTNAVYGFLNILLKLIDEVEPDYICAAFDVKVPTFRHKQYAQYKAQRKPMPEELKPQIPLAKEILTSMGIKVLELPGYEADDIIGTVSRQCEEEEIACFIATGDKDDLQLASDKTSVILTVTKKGVNETVYYDAAAVKEKYGVTPTEFIDVKALMGDASDNIPGVAGVGEKTATALIEKHKSIEYIYDNLEEIGLKGAMYEKIKNGRASAFLSKQLAAIDRNVPLETELESCRFGGKASLCGDETYSLLKGLGLNSIIKRLELKPSEALAADTADYFKGMTAVNAQSREELDKYTAALMSEKELGIIFEFDGGHLKTAAAATKELAVNFDLEQLSADTVIDALKPILEAEKITKLTADIKEALVRFSGSSEVRGIGYDASVAAYLINPARADYSADKLINEYLGIDLHDNAEEKQISLFEEEDKSYEIAAKKAFALFELKRITEELLKKNNQLKLYYEVELPLVRVLADMQIYGIKIDRDRLNEFSQMLDSRINELVTQIYAAAGEEFNINSPKQLGVILFERLGLKAVKKTKTGYSTNAEVLERLVGKHPIISLIIEYRQLAKLKSTYCDGMLAVINPQTGRIHSQFKQTVTVTGRISSTEPNMQNIPTRTELGRELRKMFVAEGEDYTLVDADYSQIELRVLADAAEDETMINAFKRGEDIHTVTAAQVLGIDASEVTHEQRSRAKAVNFGIVYGIGEFSLSQDLHISVQEARQYIEGYLEKYHGVREYMEKIKEQAYENGYVTTIMNRIRYIPELKSANHNTRSFGERVALNTPIQGTAADIIKLAMVKVHKRLNDEGLRSHLILQVHDELIIEAYIPELDRVKALLREEMENAVTLKVPLKADTSSGKSWYDAK